MRGGKELINARLSGFRPGLVHVELDLPRLPIEIGRVQVESSDRLSSIDLRCVYDLMVAISGEDEIKTKAIAKACEEAGATRVIATIHKCLHHSVFEVTEVIDSLGVLTWKH